MFLRRFTSNSSIDTFSLSRTISEKFKFKVFRVWPLTSKGHLRSNKFMDTISRSRTVSEIFKFKVFKVWPWFWTYKGQLGSKNFIPFESPCMTSYLISMDTISLSHTAVEIFDFKVFRVWPWPLTSKGHLGSIFVYHLKAHIWLPMWLLWTPSLSRTVFEIFDFKVFRFWPCPLTSKGHLR